MTLGRVPPRCPGGNIGTIIHRVSEWKFTEKRDIHRIRVTRGLLHMITRPEVKKFTLIRESRNALISAAREVRPVVIASTVKLFAPTTTAPAVSVTTAAAYKVNVARA